MADLRSVLRGAKSIARRAGFRRHHIAAARICCERAVLSVLPRKRPDRTGGRILCYHAVGTPEWTYNDISPERFRRHIELARKAGYEFVPADEIARTGGKPNQLAITFDDGVASVLYNAAPFLHEQGIPWTMFVVSDWAEHGHNWGEGLVADWRQVEKMAELGATIGSHSVTHPNFGGLDPATAREQVFESKRQIEQRLGIDPLTFAIPYGQSRDWTEAAMAAAVEAGYAVIYAQAEETRFPGTVARTKMTRTDVDFVYRALLKGAFDRWEEWY